MSNPLIKIPINSEKTKEQLTQLVADLVNEEVKSEKTTSSKLRWITVTVK